MEINDIFYEKEIIEIENNSNSFIISFIKGINIDKRFLKKTLSKYIDIKYKFRINELIGNSLINDELYNLLVKCIRINLSLMIDETEFMKYNMSLNYLYSDFTEFKYKLVNEYIYIDDFLINKIFLFYEGIYGFYIIEDNVLISNKNWLNKSFNIFFEKTFDNHYDLIKFYNIKIKNIKINNKKFNIIINGTKYLKKSIKTIGNGIVFLFSLLFIKK